MTITTTAPQDAILAPAFGLYLGLTGSANNAQVKAATIQFIRSVALVYQNAQATAGVVPVDPT
jgi:hypothetical protein